MRMRIITISHKAPTWIKLGYEEYAKRLPHPWSLELIEISPEKRQKNSDIKKLVAREGERLLAAIKPNHHLIALDISGEMWTTNALANTLNQLREERESIDFLIGGADGLSSECLTRAGRIWSLSPLTFPHMLVRIIIAEQIYRAFSLLSSHPYHRG